MNSNRLFLVGCPRSGTTLLQSMIASHTQVISFPETHFFSETLSINPILRRIRLYGARSRAVVTSFLDDNGHANIDPFSDAPFLCSHNQWCKILLHTLDEMIRQESQNLNAKIIWGLEKTPRHLFYISSIQQSGFNNKFLHILRNGPDVVASLHLATKNYPEQWDGKRSVSKCISWWNNSINESLKYRRLPNHLFVTYEQLISDPLAVLKGICGFLDINYQETMVQEYHNTADTLTKEKEDWKQKNTQQSLHKSNKLQQHFDDQTISYIKKNVRNIDLKQFFIDE